MAIWVRSSTSDSQELGMTKGSPWDWIFGNVVETKVVRDDKIIYFKVFLVDHDHLGEVQHVFGPNMVNFFLHFWIFVNIFDKNFPFFGFVLVFPDFRMQKSRLSGIFGILRARRFSGYLNHFCKCPGWATIKVIVKTGKTGFSGEPDPEIRIFGHFWNPWVKTVLWVP